MISIVKPSWFVAPFVLRDVTRIIKIVEERKYIFKVYDVILFVLSRETCFIYRHY